MAKNLLGNSSKNLNQDLFKKPADKKHNTFLFVLILAFLIPINFYGTFLFLNSYKISKYNILTVNFLNVGQGDSVLITAPNKNMILIDSSANEIVVRELSKTLPYITKKIDLFVATHADMDHVGGSPFLFKKYKVGGFAFNFDLKINNLTKEINKILDKKAINKIILKSGDKVIIDKDNEIVLQILWPHPDFEDSDRNENSIVIRLRFNEVAFMLTGDVGKGVEQHLIDLYDKEKLSSQVLKLGHHGSKTSTSENFLKFVDSDYIVISAGKDNQFGHPHQEVLDKVNDFFRENKSFSEIEIIDRIRETKNGPVIFQTNGQSLWTMK